MTELPTRMAGVLLTGHGGVERFEYRTDLPVPTPADEEVVARRPHAANRRLQHRKSAAQSSQPNAPDPLLNQAAICPKNI